MVKLERWRSINSRGKDTVVLNNINALQEQLHLILRMTEE